MQHAIADRKTAPHSEVTRAASHGAAQRCAGQKRTAPHTHVQRSKFCCARQNSAAQRLRCRLHNIPHDASCCPQPAVVVKRKGQQPVKSDAAWQQSLLGVLGRVAARCVQILGLGCLGFNALRLEEVRSEVGAAVQAPIPLPQLADAVGTLNLR